jgi:hypothetical protein
MSDEAYGSPSGDGQEGGTSSVSEEQISGQQGSQPQDQESQASEQYITKEELQAEIDRVMRSAQSMTDKMGSRLDKEIQSALNNATQAIELGKQAGMKYTPQQEQAIRDQAINGAYSKMQQERQQSQSTPSVPKQDGGNQASNPWGSAQQEILRIMGETGVFIPAEEANNLILGQDKSNKMTPYQYVQAFEQLARQRQSNTRPQGPNPALPSFAQGGQARQSQTALRQQYDKERMQIRAGNHPTIKKGDIMGIQKLEIDYRNKGLDI